MCVRACVWIFIVAYFGMYSIDTVEASISQCVVRFLCIQMNNTWSNNHCSHEMMAVSPVHHRSNVLRVLTVYVRLCDAPMYDVRTSESVWVRVMVCACTCEQ